MKVSGKLYALAALPPGKNPVPLNSRLAGPESRSECFGEETDLLPPQSLDSRYTTALLLLHSPFFTVHNLY
jgi:hypothetical protein